MEFKLLCQANSYTDTHLPSQTKETVWKIQSTYTELQHKSHITHLFGSLRMLNSGYHLIAKEKQYRYVQSFRKEELIEKKAEES